MSNKETHSDKPKTPFYQDVDGFRLSGAFCAEAFRSALTYKPRPDDLFVVTYPKCGTTWVQNIVACIFKNGKPFESAVEFLTQTPYLEMTGVEAAYNMKRPGAIKIHLPFHLTPWSEEAKYIFVARNPKDCCVSFYHHTLNFTGYKFEGGSFDDYFELFIEGNVDCGDYFDTVLSWYEHRNDPNVLFLTYEELKKDTVINILKIAAFIGPYYKEALEKDENVLQDVIKHSSFGFLKERLNKYFTEMQSMPKDLIRNHPDLPPGIINLLCRDDGVFKKKPSDITFVRKGDVSTPTRRGHSPPETNAGAQSATTSISANERGGGEEAKVKRKNG